jgi:hypothetical protein
LDHKPLRGSGWQFIRGCGQDGVGVMSSPHPIHFPWFKQYLFFVMTRIKAACLCLTSGSARVNEIDFCEIDNEQNHS